MPKISVVVPVYKVEPYINRCIDSILNQTFTDFELILVDDGSPDKCGEICDGYAKKDNRIHVIHKKNGGLSDARNAGIDWSFENSDSEWITFIDSDDWIHPNYLEVLINAVIFDKVDLSICGFERINKLSDFPMYSKDNHELTTPECLWVKDRVNSTVAWGKLYKKSFFNTLRYPKGKLHEDEYTTYKALFSCTKVSYINDAYYFYFQNDSGIMGIGWSPKWLDEIWAMKEQLSYFKKNNFINAYNVSFSEYIENLAYSIVKINECTGYNFAKCKLRLELRKCLHRSNLQFNKNKYLYRTAYPYLYRIQKFIHKKTNNLLIKLNIK